MLELKKYNMKFIPISEPNIGSLEVKYVSDAVKSGWVSSLGKYIVEFETKFSKYCERKYGVVTSNGTVALHLALLALDIGKGDEVIVPNFTFIATANAVTYTGAKVVLADIESDTWNIDPKQIEKLITKKTKAIILVPLYGHPCEYKEILAIAKKHKLKVIEDAAESHGAMYDGKKVGSFGDISCFSFYGNKTITTGEGGICLTDNEALRDKMAYLRDHAMEKDKRYWHKTVGFNYRMTNMQAALGVAQLSRIDQFIKIKRAIAARYRKNLTGFDKVILPAERKNNFHTYWMFSILLTSKAKYSRDEFMKKLKEKGVDSRPLFYPLCDLPPYKQSNKKFPVSNSVAYNGLSLPSSTKLSLKEVDFVCKVVKDILK